MITKELMRDPLIKLINEICIYGTSENYNKLSRLSDMDVKRIRSALMVQYATDLIHDDILWNNDELLDIVN